MKGNAVKLVNRSPFVRCLCHSTNRNHLKPWYMWVFFFFFFFSSFIFFCFRLRNTHGLRLRKIWCCLYSLDLSANQKAAAFHFSFFCRQSLFALGKTNPKQKQRTALQAHYFSKNLLQYSLMGSFSPQAGMSFSSPSVRLARG